MRLRTEQSRPNLQRFCRVVRASPVIIALLAFLPPAAVASNRPRASDQETPFQHALIFFASPGCDDCRWIKEDLLPRLQKTFNSRFPPVYFVNVDKKKGYKLLLSLEEKTDTTAEKFPALIAGGRIRGGQERISSWAENLTEEKLLSQAQPADIVTTLRTSKSLLNLYTGHKQKSTQQENHQAAPPGEDKRHAEQTGSIASSDFTDHKSSTLLYFYTPGCDACRRVEKQLAHAKKLYPDRDLAKLNVLTPRNRMLQVAVAKALEVPEDDRLQTPMIASGDEILYAPRITDSRLQKMFANPPESPFWQTWDTEQALSGANEEIRHLSEEMTISTVLIAGLLDGVNPCAFAVMLFLISYLCLSGGNRRMYILAYGLLFSAGVFLCYFLVGLGLSRFLHIIQQWEMLFRCIMFGVSALCIVLAVLAFVDVWLSRRSGPTNMRFGMPTIFHRAAHYLIRHSVANPLLGLGAIALGVLVSGIELVCTGQIYLPILVFITRTTADTTSVSHLLLYNTAFIAPLLTIVAIGTFGIGSQRLADWAKRHAAMTRALTGVLLLALGIAILYLGIQ